VSAAVNRFKIPILNGYRAKFCRYASGGMNMFMVVKEGVN